MSERVLTMTRSPSHSVGAHHLRVVDESFCECDEEALGEGEINEGGEEDADGRKGKKKGQWLIGLGGLSETLS